MVAKSSVHVIAGGNNFSAHIPHLRAIVKAVTFYDSEFTDPWITSVVEQADRNEQITTSWTSSITHNTELVKRADIVIIEATKSDFTLGALAYVADQYKKPTLIVSRSSTVTFASGIHSEHASFKRYTTDRELDLIVANFLSQHNIAAKDLRFNLFINRRIYKYLRDTSQETNKNKSAIVREVVRKKIRDNQQ